MRASVDERVLEGFSYFPTFLTVEEQTLLLCRLQGLEYQHDVFRGQRLKRSAAYFGYSYVAAGRRLSPAPPLPRFLRRLIRKGSPYLPSSAEFNQCIVTHYPEGAGIGWHTDARRFSDCIMAVSLGGPARLQFRSVSSGEVSYEVLTAPGSLYVMQGLSRWEYQHQVLAVKTERYSLTFRYVAEQAAERG